MSIEQLVDEFFAAIERFDEAALNRIYDEKIEIWHNFTNACMDKKTNIAGLMNFANVGTPKYTVVERHVIGDRLVQRHIVDTVLKVGGHRCAPVAIFITCRDDRIVRIDEYMDNPFAG